MTTIDLNALVPVCDDEWNEIGLQPEYFAQAFVERCHGVIFVEEDFYQIIFDGAWSTWSLPAIDLDDFVALVNERLLESAR
jgi:hypothetical protein